MQKIFVGDIQGCGAELGELLRRARSRFGDEFELWSVGDLVNRGPRNLETLELVRELEARGRAFVVLGNHDIALIEVWLGIRELGIYDTFGDVLECRHVLEWMEWLRGHPVAMTGELDGGRRFAMVHAAVDPDWSFDDIRVHAERLHEILASPQTDDLMRLLTGEREPDSEADRLRRFVSCRSVGGQTPWSSAVPAGDAEPWHRRWIASDHDYGVVYGHWAQQGLHVAPGLRGLDSGCVHHGRGRDGFLTAWLPSSEEDAFSVPDDRFWKIPAVRPYYAELREARNAE